MGNVQDKAANTKEMPERNFPVVPTTKILAIGQFTKPPTPEQIKEIFPREVPATLRLYLAGKIDQWWIRQTQTGPVFLLNVTSLEEACPDGKIAVRPSGPYEARVHRTWSADPTSSTSHQWRADSQ